MSAASRYTGPGWYRVWAIAESGELAPVPAFVRPAPDDYGVPWLRATFDEAGEQMIMQGQASVIETAIIERIRDAA
jgi:hypothetical protein